LAAFQQGLKEGGYVVGQNVAIAGTPAEIIAILYRESSKILAQSDMKERLAVLGYDLVASAPKEFATRIAAEIEMWAKVIRAANIKPQ
jgi:tripartite-type tricarboxylate transporter receptor subunit TctC